MKITIEGTIGYKKPVIPHVSLTIKEEGITCILGPNGAGKTTLLLSLAGILQMLQGEITYEPEATRLYTPPDPPYMPALRLGDVILHYISTEENYILYKTTDNHKTRLKNADIILRELGLEKDYDTLFEELSTGEKMKTILAGALASEKDIMLLDEPNNHLDIKARLKLYHYLKKKAQKKIIILTTHDINEALTYCDKTILILNDKTVIGPENPRKILTNENLKKAYGVEFTKVEQEGNIYYFPVLTT